MDFEDGGVLDGGLEDLWMKWDFALTNLDANLDFTASRSILAIHIVLYFLFGAFAAFWIVLSIGSYFSFEHVVVREHVDPFIFVDFEIYVF